MAKPEEKPEPPKKLPFKSTFVPKPGEHVEFGYVPDPPPPPPPPADKKDSDSKNEVSE